MNDDLENQRAIEPYFDREYYLAHNSDVLESGQDPLIHFHLYGWREGRNPSATFSTTYYLEANPDVADAGLNPLLHYAQRGHLENRAMHPANDDLENQRAIEPYFDREYYLAHNSDVLESGQDPLIHFHLYGWREGRNPSATFSTTYYLEANPDVADAGLNPLLHYARRGQIEGRLTAKPAFNPGEREILEQLFDREFYIDNNSDLVDVQLDLLEHFHLYGWREGRDPNQNFNTKYYLESNWDIGHAGINPLLHYGLIGKREGRSCRRKLHEARTIIEKAKHAQLYKFKQPPDSDHLRISADDILQISRRHNDHYLVFSFSHDDYAENFGGVQNIIRREVIKAEQLGGAYFHLSPIDYSRVLLEERELGQALLRCRYNGVHLGSLNMSDLIEAAAKMRGLNIRFATIVHHLMGLSPEGVAMFADHSPDRVYVWAHDFFGACEKYTLLRNDLTFCAAPIVGSGGCRICVYGETRAAHVSRIKHFFLKLNPIVVAPSNFALQSWSKLTECKFRSGIVSEPAIFNFLSYVREACEDAEDYVDASVLRVAFLGARVTHKGWDTFRTLVEKNYENCNFKFYHIGDDHGDFISGKLVRFIPTKVTASNPNAMIDAIRDHKIDVVINCTKWPETFNFITYEAVSGGAFVITTRLSGNVAEFLKRDAPSQSYVATDEDEVFSMFNNGEIFKVIAAADRRIGELKLTAGTMDLIGTEISVPKENDELAQTRSG